MAWARQTHENSQWHRQHIWVLLQQETAQNVLMIRHCQCSSAGPDAGQNDNVMSNNATSTVNRYCCLCVMQFAQLEKKITELEAEQQQSAQISPLHDVLSSQQQALLAHPALRSSLQGELLVSSLQHHLVFVHTCRPP